MKTASTREIIEKLQAYENENGIGAVIGIGLVCGGATKYEFKISNGISDDLSLRTEDYKETVVEISSVEESQLFDN